MSSLPSSSPAPAEKPYLVTMSSTYRDWLEAEYERLSTALAAASLREAEAKAVIADLVEVTRVVLVGEGDDGRIKVAGYFYRPLQPMYRAWSRALALRAPQSVREEV